MSQTHSPAQDAHDPPGRQPEGAPVHLTPTDAHTHTHTHTDADGFAIRTVGLTKVFGRHRAVDALDLAVPAGVICGFVGPNGAGKTTTIRMLLGLIRPTSGSGHVLGHSLTDPSRYLPAVGAMIEGPTFYAGLSGRDNLRVLARTGRLATDRIPVALERVGLAERGDDPFRSYSLGMKQRLGIAAALLPDPRLLVLDEPTNGLDPAGIVAVRDLLRSFREEGMTVLVSSHLLSEVEQVADHVILIRRGASVFSGMIGDLVATHAPCLVIDTVDGSGYDVVMAIAAGLGLPSRGAVGADGPGTTGLRIELPPDTLDPTSRAVAAALNARAGAAGVVLSRLEISRPTLEAAFFELTGDASGDVR